MNNTLKNILIIALLLVIVGLGYYAFVERAPEVVSPTPNPANPPAQPPAQPTPPPVAHPKDLIRVTNPKAGQVITSPVLVEGEARGYWYFEASFPVTILDGNGNEVLRTFIMTDQEWMTENYVPFRKELTFTAPATADGTLILHRDNPSGLPENDDELRIPIRFR